MLLGMAERAWRQVPDSRFNDPGRQTCYLALSRLRERLPPYATAVSFFLAFSIGRADLSAVASAKEEALCEGGQPPDFTERPNEPRTTGRVGNATLPAPGS